MEHAAALKETSAAIRVKVIRATFLSCILPSFLSLRRDPDSRLVPFSA
jgi:hypothetical protein